MFLRQYSRTVDGRRNAYWALVESYRTERGPRQRIVAWLGLVDEAERLGVARAARGNSVSSASTGRQLPLFAYEDTPAEPNWVEIDTAAVRVENCRQFGGPWLAMQLIQRLGLDDFLAKTLPPGREQVPWSLTAMILVIARLLNPSSELHIAEQWYDKTALPELLGVPADRVISSYQFISLSVLISDPAAPPGRDEDLAALDAALERLALTQPRIVELVQLRYFVGLTIPEAAAVLDIAPRTAVSCQRCQPPKMNNIGSLGSYCRRV